MFLAPYISLHCFDTAWSARGAPGPAVLHLLPLPPPLLQWGAIAWSSRLWRFVGDMLLNAML